MKLGLHCTVVALWVVIGIAGTAAAEEIRVMPGSGALAAGLAKAKVGDTVKVAAGEYAESVTVGEGVTLEGEGAAKTTIVASEYAAISCKGPRVRIVGVTVRGGEKNVRGINASMPVRVERCRFENIQEAVALMEAPLSDVLACEFHGCEIGVRAIGGASPTIWGCVFRNGKTGVFGMDGSPYIRNNLFDTMKTGIRLAPNATQPAIIRNNVFTGCEAAAIELFQGRSAIFGPSIRNTVFIRCGAALVSPPDLAKGVSHAVVHEVTAPALRDGETQETVKLGEANLSDKTISITVGPDLTVTLDHPDLVEGHGVRLGSEKEGATGTIGLERAWMRVGTGTTAELPLQRFDGKMFAVNSVHEEYQYLKTIGRKMSGQSLGKEGGVQVDRITFSDGKEPKELLFDISRFFGEESIK